MDNDVIFDTLDMKKLDDQVPWDVEIQIFEHALSNIKFFA